MKVQQIQGEPTRYHVQSTSLSCACGKRYSREQQVKLRLLPQGKCPACNGVLDWHWHLVDLADFRPIGRCSCEHFAYRLQANIAKLPPHHLAKMEQGEAAKLRCSHLNAARAFALDLTIEQHEQEQLKR